MAIVPKSPPTDDKTEGKPKSRNADGDSEATIARRKKGGTGLNDVFIVIFGLGFLMSASMNVLHSFEKIPPAQHDAVIASAMEEFKKKRPTKEEQQHQHDNNGEENNAEAINIAQHPDDHVHERPQRGHRDELDFLDHGGNHPAEIHHGDPVLSQLSCEAFGGPPDEHAQEMVYWADIPSDQTYMSPFHNGNQHEDDRKFMTLEPDGGGWNNIR